jgi:hydrogenase nickel incorporation protein HypA/HybF
MHELSIALSILEMAQEEAGRHGNVQVQGIHLKLGPLSGVVKEALVSAFDLAREGSPLANAQLKIEETPLLGHCPTCRTTNAIVSMQELCCTKCGTPTPEIVSGREMEVTALEIVDL